MKKNSGTTVELKNPIAPAEPLEALTSESGDPTSAQMRGHQAGQISITSASVDQVQTTSDEETEKAEDHWISIELTDKDGKPIPDEQYRVKLPDGTIYSGYTDAQGKARIERIPTGGTAEINFPRIHGDEWHAV